MHILKEAMHISKLRSSVFLAFFFQNSTKSSPIHLYHLFLGMLHRGGAQNWFPALPVFRFSIVWSFVWHSMSTYFSAEKKSNKCINNISMLAHFSKHFEWINKLIFHKYWVVFLRNFLFNKNGSYFRYLSFISIIRLDINLYHKTSYEKSNRQF